MKRHLHWIAQDALGGRLIMGTWATAREQREERVTRVRFILSFYQSETEQAKSCKVVKEMKVRLWTRERGRTEK